MNFPLLVFFLISRQSLFTRHREFNLSHARAMHFLVMTRHLIKSSYHNDTRIKRGYSLKITLNIQGGAFFIVILSDEFKS